MFVCEATYVCGSVVAVLFNSVSACVIVALVSWRRAALICVDATPKFHLADRQSTRTSPAVKVSMHVSMRVSMHGSKSRPSFGVFFAWVKKPTILGGPWHIGQKADHAGGSLAWVKQPTILGGSSHGSKSRPPWGVLDMGRKAIWHPEDTKNGSPPECSGQFRWILARNGSGMTENLHNLIKTA